MMWVVIRRMMMKEENCDEGDGVGVSGLNCWGIRGPAFVLLLFYVNVSGMRPRFRLYPSSL